MVPGLAYAPYTMTDKSAAARTLTYIAIGQCSCPKESVYQETLAGKEEEEFKHL